MQLIMSTDMDIGIKSTSSIDQESFKNRETTTHLVQEFMNELTNGNKENIEKQEETKEESEENVNKTKCKTSELVNSKNVLMDTSEVTSVETPTRKTSCEETNDIDSVVDITNSKLDETATHLEDVSDTENICKASDEKENVNLKSVDEKCAEKLPENPKKICDDEVNNLNVDDNINFKVGSISKVNNVVDISQSDEMSDNLIVIESIEENKDDFKTNDETKGEIKSTTDNKYVGKQDDEEMEICDDVVLTSNVDEHTEIEIDSADKDNVTVVSKCDEIKSNEISADKENNVTVVSKCDEIKSNEISCKSVEDQNDEIFLTTHKTTQDEVLSAVEDETTRKETDEEMEICYDVVRDSNVIDDSEIKNHSAAEECFVNDLSNAVTINAESKDVETNVTGIISSENVQEKSENLFNVNNTVNHISCDDLTRESNLITCKNIVENTKTGIENTDVDVSLCEEKRKQHSSDLVASKMSEIYNKTHIVNACELPENLNEEKLETVDIEVGNVDLILCSEDGNTETDTKTVSNEVDEEMKIELNQNGNLNKHESTVVEEENPEADLIVCDDLPEKSDVVTGEKTDCAVETRPCNDNKKLVAHKEELIRYDIEEIKDPNNIKKSENENASDSVYNEFAENEIINLGDDKKEDISSILKSEIKNSIDIESSPEGADQSINSDNNDAERDIDEVKTSDDIHQEDGKEIINMKSENQTTTQSCDISDNMIKHSDELEESDSNTKVKERKKLTLISKLSNTLDIFSDEEDESLDEESTKKTKTSTLVEKPSINIEDDDDIMVIDDEMTSKDTEMDSEEKNIAEVPKDEIIQNSEENEDALKKQHIVETAVVADVNKESLTQKPDPAADSNVLKCESKGEDQNNKQLLPQKFLKTCKKNLGDMTREELEEFCIIKIVESVVDRSNLGEIKSQLRRMTQHIEEYRKKASMLLKQNRDLQVVLKSVQEEQKKNTGAPVTPLKITRSVGMQVLMTEKGSRKKIQNLSTLNNSNAIFASNRQNKQQNTQARKSTPLQIPVPRLVPANNTNNVKNVVTPTQSPVTTNAKPQRNSTSGKTASPIMKPEKRTHEKMQQNSSVTVDLTDDEPPPKIVTRNANPQVRCVPPQNLVAKQPLPQPSQPLSSPRKVYIPIGTSPNQTIRPGQTIMLKSVPPNATPRPRALGPKIVQNANLIRMGRLAFKHPAPLPDSMKQYMAPNYKQLPPAPDLKLSKVENGIVISWKIDGFIEENYEEIASYQLFAYQETSSPPSTSLWKKIGDVKALPLPMACTLTQFMAGYKYYFAVRAVDIKSRFGPFSLPGSITLVNKV